MTNYKPKAKNLPQEIIGLEMRLQAFELRKMGKNYNEIGRMLGCSHTTAFKFVDEELALQREKLTENAEAVREIELQRLDEIVAAHWPMRSVTKSAEIIIKTMAQRARYLGLEAPSTDLMDAATSLRDFLSGAKANIGITSTEADASQNDE